MLLLSEYYGYRSRNHKEDKSKQNSNKKQLSLAKVINSHQKNNNIRKILSEQGQKKSERAAFRHVYNVMSPSHLAKRLSNRSNIFKEMASRQDSTKLLQSKQCTHQIDYKAHRLVNSKATPQKNHIQQKFYSEDCKFRFEKKNRKKNSYLKEIIQKKKKKEEEQLILSKRYDEYILGQSSNHHQNINKQNQHKKHKIQIVSTTKNAKIKAEYHNNEITQMSYNQCNIPQNFQISQSITIHQQPKNNVQHLQAKYKADDDYQINKISTNTNEFNANNRNNITNISSNTKNKDKIVHKQIRQEIINFEQDSIPKMTHSRHQTHALEVSDVGNKIDRHYQCIKTIYWHGDKLKRLNPQRIHAFQREVYLCFRMYYEELKNMEDVLSGKYGSSNCFKLSNCSIKLQQISQYRLKHSQQLNSRIKKLQHQIHSFHTQLLSISSSLNLKSLNDPYVKLQKSNFEPQLVSQLFQEMSQLTQKLKLRKQKHNNSSQLSVADHKAYEQDLQKRHNSMHMILLIGELKGFSSAEQKYKHHHIDSYISSKQMEQFYQQYEDNLVQIVGKFQDMPL